MIYEVKVPRHYIDDPLLIIVLSGDGTTVVRHNKLTKVFQQHTKLRWSIEENGVKILEGYDLRTPALAYSTPLESALALASFLNADYEHLNHCDGPDVEPGCDTPSRHVIYTSYGEEAMALDRIGERLGNFSVEGLGTQHES